MGKRALLLKKEAVGLVFEPRGREQALLIRIAGPDIPPLAKVASFAYVPQLGAVALILESAGWSDLATATNQINGVPFIENGAGNVHLTLVDRPAEAIPDCRIDGYDDSPPPEESREAITGAMNAPGDQEGSPARPAAALPAEQN
jgi:hypothetical protein